MQPVASIYLQNYFALAKTSERGALQVTYRIIHCITKNRRNNSVKTKYYTCISQNCIVHHHVRNLLFSSYHSLSYVL